MKNFFVIILMFLIAACSNAPTEQNKQAAPPQSPPSVSDTQPAKNPDMTEFAAAVDANKDGKMSKAEWDAKGLPPSSFNGFEKGRGFVTLDDYVKNAAPPGIDINGDGKLTVEEFLAFDKIMRDLVFSGHRFDDAN